jgi:hypothetical protein
MAVTAGSQVPAYGHRTLTEWERVMTNTRTVTTKNIDRELAEIELEHVSGGFSSTEHGHGQAASTVGLGMRKSAGGTTTGVFFLL